MEPASKTARILATLDDIESEHDVSVLFACESGSRAWGFASADSDYDVRFVYVHRTDWYLSVDVETRRHVIERPLEGDLDVNGWDLRKALQLLRKSNPPLLEWLGSPILYRERTAVPDRMRALIDRYYSPRACLYHYLHMAEGNFREFLRGDTVWIKKYFYVLRPVLAVQWIERGFGVVPTEFQALVDRLVPAGPLREAVDELLVQKRSGAELDRGPRIAVIGDFIEHELASMDRPAADVSPRRPSSDELDRLFRDALHETWRSP